VCIASRTERKKPAFKKFCRQLYHQCLERIFKPLKPFMITPKVVKCPDGHFRRAIFGLGPFIADYPEQVYLSGTVQNWCPTYVFSLVLSSKISHQPIAVMPLLRTLTANKATLDHTRRQIFSLASSIQESSGMNLGSEVILWYVLFSNFLTIHSSHNPHSLSHTISLMLTSMSCLHWISSTNLSRVFLKTIS